jgi:predicted Holliday junction resolvase-like endonuclease
MTPETRGVKGGFRATLALIISIIALVLAIIAFNRTGGQGDLNAQIKDLKTKMETKETSEKVSKVRQETTKALEKVGIDIKKEDKKD